MDTVTETHLLQRLTPSAQSRRVRREVLELLQWNLEKCLRQHRAFVACYGSYPLQTFLPCSDIDITVIVADCEEREVLRTVRRQMEFTAIVRPQFEVKSFCEINAEVKVLKMTVKGVSVDVSVNQVGGLRTLWLMELVDSFTDRHLFKRTLMVVKAWATYESRIAGSQYGLLASYALSVLVIYVLNCHPPARASPLAALRELLRVLHSLNWEESVVTCFGVVPIDAYLQGQTAQSSGPLLFTASEVHREGRQAAFPRKYMNLADPLRADNNLGRSVSRSTFERIRLAFRAAAAQQDLFPTLLMGKVEAESGSSSPSTSSEGEEDTFAALLGNANETVKKAVDVIRCAASKCGKPLQGGARSDR